MEYFGILWNMNIDRYANIFISKYLFPRTDIALNSQLKYLYWNKALIMNVETMNQYYCIFNDDILNYSRILYYIEIIKTEMNGEHFGFWFD